MTRIATFIRMHGLKGAETVIARRMLLEEGRSEIEVEFHLAEMGSAEMQNSLSKSILAEANQSEIFARELKKIGENQLALGQVNEANFLKNSVDNLFPNLSRKRER